MAESVQNEYTINPLEDRAFSLQDVRRQKLLSELLQATELCSPAAEHLVRAPRLDTGSNIDALWIAVEALWKHQKSE